MRLLAVRNGIGRITKDWSAEVGVAPLPARWFASRASFTPPALDELLVVKEKVFGRPSIFFSIDLLALLLSLTPEKLSENQG